MVDKEFYKRRIYEIIEASKGDDFTSKTYDLMISVAVIVGVLPLTMKTTNKYITDIDLTTTAIFLIDYLMRLYTSDYKMGVKSYKAYIAYMVSPLAVVDLLSIIPIVTIFLPQVAIIKLIRIFRIFRVFKLVRYSKTMVNITNVIRKVKRQLVAVLVITVIYIVTSAMFIFQIEPDIFNNFFDALYWATISITTIGYGDISPVSTAGRFVTMISSLVGVAVIALPSGIITAAYMDEIKKKKSRLEL
ncbi:MAG: ion transporter [Lachnospiraceae bacterium]|nr:ion transporter [Lachnospiraceae bacterium]